MQGIIKSKTDKGFGFIGVDGREKDVFFHSSSVMKPTFDELNVGDTVTFEEEASEKGPRAVNVVRV